MKNEGFIIREFQLKDLDRVLYINRTTLPENYPPFFFVEHYRSFPKAFLVAELNGEVVGYVMCRVEYGRSLVGERFIVKKGHVISLAVLPEARRRGIGTALMKRAMEAMKNVYKVSEYYLEVRKSNTPAISLYRKLGFKTVNIIPRYYHNGEDAYLMARTASS